MKKKFRLFQFCRFFIRIFRKVEFSTFLIIFENIVNSEFFLQIRIEDGKISRNIYFEIIRKKIEKKTQKTNRKSVFCQKADITFPIFGTKFFCVFYVFSLHLNYCRRFFRNFFFRNFIPFLKKIEKKIFRHFLQKDFL
jgi:hypothetical protein